MRSFWQDLVDGAATSRFFHCALATHIAAGLVVAYLVLTPDSIPFTAYLAGVGLALMLVGFVCLSYPLSDLWTQRASSIPRFSRMPCTLISPGYCSSFSI